MHFLVPNKITPLSLVSCLLLLLDTQQQLLISCLMSERSGGCKGAENLQLTRMSGSQSGLGVCVCVCVLLVLDAQQQLLSSCLMSEGSGGCKKSRKPSAHSNVWSQSGLGGGVYPIPCRGPHHAVRQVTKGVGNSMHDAGMSNSASLVVGLGSGSATTHHGNYFWEQWFRIWDI
jgi:hypothetical protein